MLTAAMVVPGITTGQERLRVAGRVLRMAPGDSVPVPAAVVVLHSVGRDFQGAIDSTETDADGAFSISTQRDTAAVFLLSTGYQGIQYFSTPVHTNPARPDTAIRLVVSDTSSVAAVEVRSRDLVVGRPRDDGTREVVDLLTIGNAGVLTRVTGSAQQPTWSSPLQSALIAPEVRGGDFSPEAVFFRDGRVEVFGPIAPGQKELLLHYIIPKDLGRFLLTFLEPVADVRLLIEDAGPSVTADWLALPDTQTVSGQVFRRWSGSADSGSTIILTLPTPGPWSTAFLVGLVMTMAAALVGFGYRAVRVRGAAAVETPREGVRDLVRQLAELDAQYEGREGEVPEDEWGHYLAQRARLKDVLQHALAARGPET